MKNRRAGSRSEEGSESVRSSKRREKETKQGRTFDEVNQSVHQTTSHPLDPRSLPSTRVGKLQSNLKLLREDRLESHSSNCSNVGHALRNTKQNEGQDASNENETKREGKD